MGGVSSPPSRLHSPRTRESLSTSQRRKDRSISPFYSGLRGRRITMLGLSNPQPSTLQPLQTDVLQIHQACSYCWTIVSRDPDYPFRTWHYRGEDAVEQFLNDMLESEEALLPCLKEPKPMLLTAEQKAQHYRAKTSYICHKPFTEEDWRVHDHDHATGA